MRMTLFFLLFPFAVYKALKDPVWATCIAAFLYFAIPEKEFFAPTFPYQAAFWFLAIITSARLVKENVKLAKETLAEAGASSGRAAIERIREGFEKAIVEATLLGMGRDEIRRRALDYAVLAAGEIAAETTPVPLLPAVKESITKRLQIAAEEGAREASEVMANAANLAPPVLRRSVQERVRIALDHALNTGFAFRARAAVLALLSTDEANPKKRSTGRDRGPLSLPMPRRALAGILTNSGIWFHSWFILLTFIGARAAKHDVPLAMDRFIVSLLLLLPLLAITSTVRTPETWRRFVWTWLFGIWWLCMNGINQWLRWGGRADSPGGQGNEANFLGAIAVFAAPIAFSWALNDRDRRGRIVAAIAAGSALLAILASGSRGALAAVCAATAYWLIYTERRKIALGLGMVAVSGFLALAPQAMWERVSQAIGQSDTNPWIPKETDLSTKERLMLWDLAAKTFVENPVAGIGPQQFVRESEVLPIIDAYAGMRGMMVHNSWLQIAAEYGILGLLVWGGAFVLSMFSFRKARKRLEGKEDWRWFTAGCLGFEAALVGTAVVICFSSFHWYDYMYWVMIFGPLTLGIAHHVEDRVGWLSPRVRALVPRPPPRTAAPNLEAPTEEILGAAALWSSLTRELSPVVMWAATVPRGASTARASPPGEALTLCEEPLPPPVHAPPKPPPPAVANAMTLIDDDQELIRQALEIELALRREKKEQS